MKFLTRRGLLGLACSATLTAGLAAPAFAQGGNGTFPSQPIRLLVPFAPGGGTDLVMRAIAPGMAKELGQPVVVENRPGASTQIATDAVVRSAPDGYTLLAVSASIYLNAARGVKTRYDPLKDLVPLSLLVNNPGLLLVSKNVKAQTLPELVALSKSRPNGLNYASAGTGTIGHLEGELLKARLGLKMQHIPFMGSAPALAALVGNQVDVALDLLIPSGAQVTAGAVRALAIASAQRSPLLPDVPTLAELGHQGVDFGGSFGLMLPANTPPGIVKQLHSAAMSAISDPATRKQLLDMGYEIVASTPEQFDAFLRQQMATWTEVVKDNDIKIE
ncbi:tripartite tricarboxylate transporter substrate binding protein [Bordetella petrii]|nr:tripartite tricarboxylate transporter substrate binding protein [Bordetella petrii]